MGTPVGNLLGCFVGAVVGRAVVGVAVVGAAVVGVPVVGVPVVGAAVVGVAVVGAAVVGAGVVGSAVGAEVGSDSAWVVVSSADVESVVESVVSDSLG